MARIQREAKEQIDEAEEAARLAAAEAERQRVLAERGLTEKFEADLKAAKDQIEQQQARRKAAEEARAKAEQQSLEERQAIETERKRLEDERLKLEEERLRLEAQHALGDVPPAQDSDAPAQPARDTAPVIAAARSFMDGIELDPLSTDDNAAVQAQRYHSDPEYSLSQSWQAASLWLELPPDLGQSQQFTEKLFSELAKSRITQAVVLADSAHSGADWAQRLLTQADAFCFLKAEDAEHHSVVFLLGDNAQSDLDSFAHTFEPLGAIAMPFYEPNRSQ